MMPVRELDLRRREEEVRRAAPVGEAAELLRDKVGGARIPPAGRYQRHDQA